MSVIYAVLPVFILLLISEFWWRRRQRHGELSRKFVHLAVGSLVAFWPFYLGTRQIQFLSLAFLLVVGLSKYLKVFKAIHSVQRPTWGEIFFALAVGLTTLVAPNRGLYAAALLQMSLADGLAAVLGSYYGGVTRYKIFGQTKSLVGTSVFFVTSLTILAFYVGLAGVPISVAAVIGVPLLLALLENVAPFGLDNLLVPIAFALILAQF